MGDKFYAVAHGRKPGVYEDWNEAQKQIKDYHQPVYKKFATKEEAEEFFKIADYPQPMYKKFEDLAEAKAYFEKYTTGDNHTEDEKTGKGIVEMGSTEKERGKEKSHKKEDSKNEDKDNSRDKDNSKEKVYYAVARGHKPGVYATWAECQEQTKDFKGAKFKKFTDEEEAKMFAEGKTLKQIEERKRPHEKDDEEDEVDHKKAAKEKEKA
ncbi:Ribonuclease H [Toxocara canis]|uniref:ribonuclease H n=1 Tax=Toxocara canis TaxID=6265 RepID=A0A0B2W079_TOXCA|nr:Ribonuclease H [Toxocara canis]